MNPISKSKTTSHFLKNCKDKSLSSLEVTVIVNTMRENSIDNVLNNYERQIYNAKEMIIVLNNNNMNLKKWMKKARKYKNIRVYQLDENISAGSCLNFAVSKAKYDIIAKFDDDDYYGPKYLISIVDAFQKTDADVVGKAASFVYFKKSKTLAIRHPEKENKFVYHMDGPTMSVKKHVFEKIKFRDISRGVDTDFSKDCVANKFKIYSTNRFHHVYIRQESPADHCWKISDEDHLKMCTIVSENVENYKDFVDI